MTIESETTSVKLCTLYLKHISFPSIKYNYVSFPFLRGEMRSVNPASQIILRFSLDRASRVKIYSCDSILKCAYVPKNSNKMAGN